MKLMKKQGISTDNTVALLSSQIIKKSGEDSDEADNKLRKVWAENIGQSFRINPEDISLTLGYGVSFIHFKREVDLNKFLFIKFMEKKRNIVDESRGSSRSLTLAQILPHLGDIDYMEEGSTMEHFKEQKIVVDNFSSNRVVAYHNEKDALTTIENKIPYRLLITNSIVQQSARLSCRFTSLLPDIPNL